MAEDTTEKAIYSLNLSTKAVSTIAGSVGLFSPRLSTGRTVHGRNAA
jgi:hypothetical protein